MYHYRESGLPHVYLRNGYREIDTANGKCVAIQNVEGLHAAIAWTIVNERPFITGPEVRFVRKYLDLSQADMASYLGVEEQTVRRWEKLARIPKQADHGLRLMFRDLVQKPKQKPLPTLVRHIGTAPAVQEIHYSFRDRARVPWQSDLQGCEAHG